ncbi:hypothetical protein PAMC26577_36455 [Caballeronia sordidicola]|uniref:Uncharacterized protein n=1 Tax=Caballeronia sordidicola TaxID=196367 RepID=A0A242M8I1_CABSO|nr:hypothetical protein PAMC26577_36455 [Caballeronia sordidicola]
MESAVSESIGASVVQGVVFTSVLCKVTRQALLIDALSN